MTASEVLKKAYEEIGVTEYPPRSNNVKYNTEFYGRPVADGVPAGTEYPWCCVFVWWVLNKCGVSVPKTASCMNLGQWFKNEHRWFTKPQVGDVVFFKFGKNSRWTDHVGFVSDVNENYIYTIEGNTSINSENNGGAVMKRKRASSIVGFGRPVYSEAGQQQNIQHPTMKEPVLKRGDRGEYVKAWQTYLQTCGFSCGKHGADGIFGKDTENALKSYQKSKGLPITGIVDADDWASVGK